MEKINNTSNDRPWLKYWVAHFKNDEQFGNKRFKFMESCEISFHIDEGLVDFVGQEEYDRIEDDRIPLLIGTQFGIAPGFSPDFFNGDKVVAILAKSLLSGAVNGVRFYRVDKHDTTLIISDERIIKDFPNKEVKSK